jgi:hypothetical protein
MMKRETEYRIRNHKSLDLPRARLFNRESTLYPICTKSQNAKIILNPLSDSLYLGMEMQ